VSRLASSNSTGLRRETKLHAAHRSITAAAVISHAKRYSCQEVHKSLFVRMQYHAGIGSITSGV
jgi:hypothetical protein